VLYHSEDRFRAAVQYFRFVARFGILRVGAAQVGVNPMHAPRELKHQHHDAGVATNVYMTRRHEP